MYRTPPKERTVKVRKQLTKAELTAAVQAFLNEQRIAEDNQGNAVEYELAYLAGSLPRMNDEAFVLEISWDEDVIDE
jgi:hypothetical protein